jgi:hypothetical protein
VPNSQLQQQLQIESAALQHEKESHERDLKTRLRKMLENQNRLNNCSPRTNLFANSWEWQGLRAHHRSSARTQHFGINCNGRCRSATNLSLTFGNSRNRTGTFEVDSMRRCGKGDNTDRSRRWRVHNWQQ